ncbi:MAG: TerB family tellurite resistance protein [Cyclobacteriaceae bacterium]
MKIVFIAIMAFLCMCFPGKVRAQTQEATQLMLNYEKLRQLEAILDNMYKGYKVLSKGYNTVRDIAEGNFSIHQVFLDGLYMVSPAVKNYRRIPEIIRYQKFLVKEYKRAFDRFRNDTNLTLREIKYIGNVYSYLIKQSLRNLDELLMVITASKLRMSDQERLQAIDRIFYSMEEKVSFLIHFNNSTGVLIVQRAKSNRDVNTTQKLYEPGP